ncbi:MAG: hypothetical protein WC356_02780 [Candidatus Micrarchaeia archaeon]|jgi:hypothetical protein
MYDEEIKYSEKHKCIPNEVGDFDLICPDVGKVQFVPMLQRGVSYE